MNIQTTTTASKDSTELAVMKPLTAAIVFAPGGVDAILEKLTAEVRSIKTDISTPAGRAAIASLAHKVARSKTALDGMGKDLVSEWKTRASAVDAERRTIRERLDALKDEVRKPLTDWENAEKARVESHEAELLHIADLATFAVPPNSEGIRGRIVMLSELPRREWQEFSARAAEAMSVALFRLDALLKATEKQEAERAELERLRREQVEREQRERDEKIAAEAAERARVAAETKAAREAEEVAERAAAERRRVEQERAEAVARAERVEAEARAAAERAEQQRIRAAAQAEASAKAAAEKAERERQAAISAERQRVADEQAAQTRETAKREADKKHRAKINGAARDALVNIGLTTEHATATVTAIAKGEVPHTTISY